jgi:flagellar motor switch protein FliG
MASRASTALARSTHAERYALDRLTGRQKVAIICMVVGREHAAKLTAHLTPEEAEIVALEMAQLDRVPLETVESVLADWVELTLGVDSLSSGGVDFARDVLERAFGAAKADAILARIQGQLENSDRFGRLRRADPQQLGNTLRGEHPQTIALILAHLDPGHVAAILREVDPTLGGDVMYRIARMEKVSPEMISLVERAIGSEADLAFSQGMSSVGGPAAVAAILNLVSTSLEKEVLDLVADRDQHLSDQIKNLMFVFEDLGSLDDKSLQRLLREVDVKQLALALKAASAELKAKILATMSQRAVAGLKEEMEFLGPVKMRDVEAAQTDIVAKVRSLEETGDIVLSAGTDDVII